MCGAALSLDLDEDPCPSCLSKREMEREELLASMLGRVGDKRVEAFYAKCGDGAYIVYTAPLPWASKIGVRVSTDGGSAWSLHANK